MKWTKSPRDDMNITFKPIGTVHNSIVNRKEMPIKGVVSQIKIFKKYKKALYKIEKQTHLWVLSYLHAARKNVLVVTPRKSTKLLQKPYGVFSVHSPDRPNPIGLSKVKLIARKGLVLYVKNLDVINGTPILDIKSFQL
jgi:tRNA (adenine37-N6)-methyltransferase